MAKMRVTDRDGIEHEIEGQLGVKLMETLREYDYGVTAICGGLCSCATCHIFIDPEWIQRLPVPQGDEKELLVELQHYDPSRSRLSCQVDFTPDLDGLRLEVARTSDPGGGKASGTPAPLTFFVGANILGRLSSPEDPDARPYRAPGHDAGRCAQWMAGAQERRDPIADP